jgi:3-oxoacyl-[acyl-carrier protein] reductase
LIIKNCNKPVAFITGSSRGIGFAIAYKLAKSGFSIVLNGKKESKELIEAQKKIIKDSGEKVMILPFDITDSERYDWAIKQIISQFGKIDCLVNNAGKSVKKRGDLLDISYDSFDEQIDINLKSHFFITQKIAKWMVENKSNSFRSIINISSSNAQAVSINRAEYCVAKAGLSMMSKLFAVRLAPEGINVYDIMPGLIKTDMTIPSKKYYNEILKDGFSPINRWGKPKDVAEVVNSLALGNMSFVTGETIHVDGGLLINRY